MTVKPTLTKYLRSFFCIVTIILNVVGSGHGQDLPVGRIDKDTVRTGESFEYSLSFRHPPRVEVFFPDSNYHFYPFQFKGQKVFPTTTDHRGSLDSAVYQLVSFEVTPKIGLALPVYIWDGKDCTVVYPPTDSSVVALFVDRARLDSLTPGHIPELVPLKEEMNYSAILILVLALATTAFLINWLFGKRIRQQWNVFRLQRRHREFVRNFNRHMANAKNRNSIKDVEMALVLWKNYLERLDNIPFTTFTTREISDTISDASLSEALRETDKVIYGFASQSTDIGSSLMTLHKVAQKLYLQKRKKIIATNTQG
ncbi:MAG: hypothetical protein WCY86_13745 [Spirosomataceae bacterium]